MDFDRGGADLEASASGVKSESVFDLSAVEFVNFAAGFADLEGGDTRMDLSVLGMTADDKGIEAFEPVNATRLNQLVQRTIDLQGCFESLVAQPVEDAIGTQRLVRGLQHRENEALVSCQFQIFAIDCLQHAHLRKVMVLGVSPELIFQVRANEVLR
jgi:hypothetical protein